MVHGGLRRAGAVGFVVVVATLVWWFGSTTGVEADETSSIAVPAACTGAPVVDHSFTAVPTPVVTFGDGARVCHELPTLTVGARILFEVDPIPTGRVMAVVDADGVSHCTRSVWSCSLDGPAPFRFVVETYVPAQFSVVIHRLDDPVGCEHVGPEHHSFDGPAIDDVIDGPLDMDCFTYDREAGDEFRRAVVGLDGADHPRMLEFRADRECVGSFGHDTIRHPQPTACGDDAHRRMVIVGRGYQPEGAYRLILDRLNDPIGCRAMSSRWDVPAETGGGDPDGFVDCFTIDGVVTGDVLQPYTTAMPGDRDDLFLFTQTGAQACFLRLTHPCEVIEDGPHIVLRYSAEEYELSTRRVNDPEGCRLFDAADLRFDAPAIAAPATTPADRDCYRVDGPVEGRYGFHAAAVDDQGPLPDYTVFADDGTPLPWGCHNVGPCDPDVPDGQGYSVVVESRHDYRIAARRYDAVAGCGPEIDLTWGGSTVDERFPAGAAPICRMVDVAAGDRIFADQDGGSARVELRDATGALVCDPTRHQADPCTVSGTSPWYVTAFREPETAPEPFRLVIRGVSDPSGCDSVGPDVIQFGGDRVVSAAGPADLGWACRSFSAEAGAVVSIRVHAPAAPATTWRLFDMDGDRVCVGRFEGTSAHLRRCEISSTGTMTLVLDLGAVGVPFELGIDRLDEPVGCDVAIPVAFGERVAGVIDERGDARCHPVDLEPGDQVWLSLDGAGRRFATMVDANGAAACVFRPDESGCEVVGVAPFHALVIPTSHRVGGEEYMIDVRRLNDPEGCRELPMAALAYGDGALPPESDQVEDPAATSYPSGCVVLDNDKAGAVSFAAVYPDGDDGSLFFVGPDHQPGCDAVDGACRLRLGSYLLIAPETAHLVANRRTDPVGCVDLGTVADDDVPPVEDHLDAHDVHCLRIDDAPGTDIGIGRDGVSFPTVYDADGRQACERSTDGCTLEGRSPHIVEVQSSRYLSVDYLVHLTCRDCVVEPVPDIVTVAPFRVLETRASQGQVGYTGARPGSGSTVVVQVGGVGPVPGIGVGSALLDLTVVAADRPGYVTAWACDDQRPLAAAITYGTGQTVTNLALADLASDGTVCLYTSAGAHLVVDVTAWSGARSGVRPVTPSRLLDTRSSGSTGRAGGRPTSGSTVRIPVRGRGGAPSSGIGTAFLNVSVTAPERSGHLTVWSCDEERPLAAALTYDTGKTVTNLAAVGVGSSGDVCVFTSAGAHLVVDLAGWGAGGADLRPIQPHRMTDTRRSTAEQPASPVRAGTTFELQVAGVGGVPSGGVAAALLNVSVTGTAHPGHLTAWDCADPRPTAAVLTFGTDTTVTNLAVSSLRFGEICFAPSADVHLIVDAVGWVAGSP